MTDADQHPEAVELEEREPQPVLSIRATVPVARLTDAQGESLRALWAYRDNAGWGPPGRPSSATTPSARPRPTSRPASRSPRPWPARAGSRPASCHGEPPSPPG